MAKDKRETLPLRLSLRAEGAMWNAYAAPHGTMEGAMLIGSIAMAFVADNAERKQAFQQMMAEAFADLLENIIGERPEMETRQAPEHERAGHS